MPAIIDPITFSTRGSDGPNMRAFVEQLCPHCIIVRAGPLAESYGCEWDTEWTGHIERRPWWRVWEPRWAWVTVKGFAGRDTPDRHEAAVRVANKHTGFPVRWKRQRGKKGAYWLHQVSGVDGKEQIRMAVQL